MCFIIGIKSTFCVILNKEALYFFATNNKDSLFMKEELSEKQKSKMQEVLKSLIKNQENYHEDFQKQYKC